MLSPDDIKDAVKALSAGNLIAVPTETVYGLAADAFNSDAVARIYDAKSRPHFNPLICHVAGADMASKLVHVSSTAAMLMDAFWPGPLTLVLPALPDNNISPLVSAELDTLAVRAPDNATTRLLISALGHPIAAPSANPSGKISPTTAADVARTMADNIACIIDDGPCGIGLESTIIGVDDNVLTLLRPGSVTTEEIEAVCGQPVHDNKDLAITAPGQLTSHYAPDNRLRMNCSTPDPGEFFIGFGTCAADFNLSPSGDLHEAAANLFRALHIANASGKPIAVAPVPTSGVGLAINDRLGRAAAPRPAMGGDEQTPTGGHPA